MVRCGMERKEYEEIKAVCVKYGYGNVMELASALWKREFLKNGLPDIMVEVPAAIPAIKKGRWLKCIRDSQMIYDSIVKNMEDD
jgi:hypothetical protein